MSRSRRGFGQVKDRSKIDQGKVERQGQGKINERLKQSNHNHNHNYNLMGFDTIEINLSSLSEQINLGKLSLFRSESSFTNSTGLSYRK